MARQTALKKAVSGKIETTHHNKEAGARIACGSRLLKAQVLMPMLARFQRVVEPLKSQMVRNLPQTISSRLAGLISRVSMVPRSFSPAQTSTAGYRAPASDHMTSMNGKM